MEYKPIEFDDIETSKIRSERELEREINDIWKILKDICKSGMIQHTLTRHKAWIQIDESKPTFEQDFEYSRLLQLESRILN